MALPFSYNVRNAGVRWRLTGLAVGGIAVVVAVFAVLMAMSEGFASALRASGREDNGLSLSFAVLMGVLGGLLPALRASRLPIAAALREG